MQDIPVLSDRVSLATYPACSLGDENETCEVANWGLFNITEDNMRNCQLIHDTVDYAVLASCRTAKNLASEQV